MSRPRGRPRKTDDVATRDRLLDAAAAECIQVGFDAVTLAAVARRADVTPAAVYNHFAGKADLLYAAGRLAIERLHARAAPSRDPRLAAHEIAEAYLQPSFRDGRRLILELHLAGARHPELAAHLADWQREFAAVGADDANGRARVKALFLLLLGLCHLDDLDGVEVPNDDVRKHVAHLVDALHADGPAPPRP